MVSMRARSKHDQGLIEAWTKHEPDVPDDPVEPCAGLSLKVSPTRGGKLREKLRGGQRVKVRNIRSERLFSSPRDL